MLLFYLLLLLSLSNVIYGQTDWSADTQRLAPSGLASNANFGRWISVSGTKAAITAINQNNVGAVYTYQYVGGDWIQDNTILRPPPTAGLSANFGISHAMENNMLVISADLDDTDGSDKGRVYVYTWDGSAWNEDSIIQTPSDCSNRFGRQLTMSGTKLAVSCTGKAPVASGNGVIITYQWSGSAWVKDPGYLAPDSLQTNNFFGYFPFNMDGNTIAVGSPNDSVTATSAGAVYTFEWNGTDWQTPTAFRPTSTANVQLGKITAVSGTRFATLYSQSGDGKVYTYNNGQLDGTVLDIPFANTDNFGLVMDGDRLAVSSMGTQQVYTFTLINDVWTQDQSLLQPLAGTTSGNFGKFMALDGVNLLVGQIDDDVITTDAGSVTAFKVLIPPPEPRYSNSIGSINQSITQSNITLGRIASQSIISQLKSTVNITQTLRSFVNGSETIELNTALFTNYNDDAALLAHIKDISCPATVSDFCEIAIVTGGGGRRLQGSFITVELTYSMEDNSFETLVNDGVTFSDGSAFESALAAALGVTTGEIVINAVSGQLSIEYVISQEATGTDPLTEEQLLALSEVLSDLITISSTIESELGLTVGTPSIDYCAGRDCNGRGTCDTETGVCQCSGIDYWGINCETLIYCGNGFKSPSEAVCYCYYPSYGVRCELTKDCSCTQV